MIKDNYMIYLVSLLYAIVFVYFIPWVSLNGGGFELNGTEFKDTGFYITRIIYLKSGGDEGMVSGPLSWFFSEPLWKEIILFIGNTFEGNRYEDFRAPLYGISLIITFIYTAFLLKRVEFYIVMIFFLNPMIVQIFIEQIRIGLAFSLVLIAYDLSEKKELLKISSIVLLVMAFFIHSAMIVFYGIFYLLYKLNKKVEDKKYYLIAIGTAMFIAFFMKFGSNIILLFVGDRRANYSDIIDASPLTYTLAWLIIAFILATLAEFKEPKNRILVAYAITIMCFFFFSSLLGVFALRYVSVIMPIIILSISYLPKHYKQGTYLFLFAYNIFLFKYWMEVTVL